VERRASGGVREVASFKPVDEPILELEMTTDMVCVRMGRDRYDRLFK